MPRRSLSSVNVCTAAPPAPCRQPPGDTGGHQSHRWKHTCRARQQAQAAPRGDGTRAHGGASTPCSTHTPWTGCGLPRSPGTRALEAGREVSVSRPHAGHGRRCTLTALGPCLHRPSVTANGPPPVSPHRCGKEGRGGRLYGAPGIPGGAAGRGPPGPLARVYQLAHPPYCAGLNPSLTHSTGRS